MHKLLVIFLFSLIMALTAQGQTAPTFHHQIGVAGSLISGMGISYQYIFSDDYRVKCTGLYYTETKSTDILDERKSMDTQAGMELQKSIYMAKNTRVFAFAGAGVLLSTKRDFDVNASLESRYRWEYYHGGAGVGIELIAAGRISFNVEVGALYSVRVTSGEFDSAKHSVYETFSRREVGFGIGGGLGIGYRF